MSSILFNCDYGGHHPELNSEWDQIIQLNQYGKNSNLRLDLEDVTAKILRILDPIVRDLIQIAFYVYAGDQLVSRGGITDVYARKWERNLHFVIPVSNPQYWSQPAVVEQLIETLNFLSGDIFDFSFVKNGRVDRQQLPLDIRELELAYQGADCVILFSGGADSLSAVIEQISIYGRHPILVSHRSTPPLDSRQSKIVDHLKNKFPSWCFPHVSVWANLKGQEAKDFTQRSRSFLYASLAAAVAYQTKVKDIILSDNGIVSINLPKNGHLKGTFATRTTHPKFLWNFQKLIRIVLNSDLTIRNPLIFYTKADVLEILKKHGCEELLQETVSCARTRQPQVTPHCGLCSQCIDRRFGSEAAGMEQYDIVERYGVDIFTEAIPEGEGLNQVEIFIRFVQQLDKLSDDEIFNEYPELLDCILADDPDSNATAKSYIGLLKRHAKQIREVMARKFSIHADHLYEVSLPASSLIRLVVSGQLSRDHSEILAEKIEKILKEGLPKIFQSRDPKNEHEVQNASDGLLSAAGEKLLRELPFLPFAGISAKPDFSKLDDTIYYIEMKYIKTRQRLNSAITEITSRIHIYETQKAYVHFVVYDPQHYILDEEAMKQNIEINGRVRLGIIH